MIYSFQIMLTPLKNEGEPRSAPSLTIPCIPFQLLRDICSCADEFEDLVQRNLAANCGLDFHGLVKLLSTIAHRLLHADASGTCASRPGIVVCHV